MTSWKVDNTYRPPGITCDILVQDTGPTGMPRWKRVDHFGHMTDLEVAEYKAARPKRYAVEVLEDLVARVAALEGVA